MAQCQHCDILLNRSPAVISLSSLCLIEGRPPRGQLKACSTVKGSLQTQLDGNKGGRQPYLRHKASLKAPSCKTKPCSDKGRAVNQLEEPISTDKLTDLCKDDERDGSKDS